MNCAVIVENREPNIKPIIERHLEYLSGWDHDHVNITNIQSLEAYNMLMTSEGFWKRYLNYERVLIFQHDSGILRKGIDEFLEWDYVGAPWMAGAPWARKDRKGGNGGLSLRCPKKALTLIQQKKYNPSYGNEDVYYTHYLEEVGARVAPYEVCRKFSVETDFQLGTFGYHAIDKHLTEKQVEEIKCQYIKDMTIQV